MVGGCDNTDTALQNSLCLDCDFKQSKVSNIDQY